MPMLTATQTFLDYAKLEDLSGLSAPSFAQVEKILAKAKRLKGITTEEAALLLAVQDPAQLSLLLAAAHYIKEEIYGKRLVLFAPLYTGNFCTNDCLYCGFRRSNHSLERKRLTMDEIAQQTSELLKQGHKRILIISGEAGNQSLEYTLEAIQTSYGVREDTARVRRINVEIAPLSVEGFRALKKANIGTYVCFQETYNPELYAMYHPDGPKADYRNRLYVMDRAMEGGIDDVGIGALFGLGNYRYEVLAILEHAHHLEAAFGCGPHTVSVPRIEPAKGAPLSFNPPAPVSDIDFKKLIAIIRISLPYTGIILSTRESPALRKEIFAYGVSQISAGSKTDPGGYSAHKEDNGQFSVGDNRTLEEVISDLIDDGYIPSFCTGCYRRGRVGADFMDLAKPGLIKEFCLPNGLVSFAEYLYDYASPPTRQKGLALIEAMKTTAPAKVAHVLDKALLDTASGERDIYL
ncbi:MAG: [FeFe] hydrogenase H-cluster radical SAM maturase HydG [Rectinema subterraneum]|jgi:2-iminoacetate synthase